MHLTFKPIGVLIAVVSALCLLTNPATAQGYPNKPIRLVIGYPPGGASDVVARAIALPLGERLKQAIVVDNRPGASGMIASEIVAKAPADGYTLLLAVADTHSINPHLYSTLRYDVKRDVTPVGLVGYVSFALITSPNVNVKTVPDFIAYAKASSKPLTYGSWGVGSSGQVVMEMLKTDAKINLLHIPFQGAAPALTAVMGNQVDSMMIPFTLAEPSAKAGKVHLLALAAPQRFATSPDIATFADQGVRLSAPVWIGIVGPANLPREIVSILSAELNNIINLPQVRETMVKNGVSQLSEVNTPELFKTFMDTQYDHWGAAIRAAGIKLD